MTEAQKTLYYIAENMRMTKSISKDGYEHFQQAIKALEQTDILDKIKAEIKAKIEEEEFARSVFRYEEKNAVKVEQCTGSIMAYNNMIKLIDKYKEGEE